MTNHEAMRYWLMKYNLAKSYTDDHWEAAERREHEEYVEACEKAFEALDERANEKYVELKDGMKKFCSGNFVVYDIDYLLENLAREAYLLVEKKEYLRQLVSKPLKPKPLKLDIEDGDGKDKP